METLCAKLYDKYTTFKVWFLILISRDFDFRKLSKLSFRFVSPEIFKFSELDEVNRKQEDESSLPLFQVPSEKVSSFFIHTSTFTLSLLAFMSLGLITNLFDSRASIPLRIPKLPCKHLELYNNSVSLIFYVVNCLLNSSVLKVCSLPVLLSFSFIASDTTFEKWKQEFEGEHGEIEEWDSWNQSCSTLYYCVNLLPLDLLLDSCEM